MFSIVGYNFVEDVDAITTTPTNLQNLNNTKIQNGIFDNLWITRDATSEYPSSIPTTWDYLTILNANFNGNLHAGNIDFVADQITAVRIKRRIKGTFDWIILYEIPINSIEDLSFVKQDNLNQNGVEYEYAFVPMIENNELNYITNSVVSEFNGVFICDINTIFKYYANVSYEAFERINRSTVFEPLGRQYPVVVSNALINYETGTINGTVILDEDLYNSALNRIGEVQYRNNLLDFLVNKKAKIIKDWCGGIWLCIIVGSPSISFFNEIGMGLAKVQFDFAQIGNANNADDLYNSGMIDITTGGL